VKHDDETVLVHVVAGVGESGSDGARTSRFTPSLDAKCIPRRAITTGTMCMRAAFIASMYARPVYDCPESRFVRRTSRLRR
jgi:hypothetical protein